METHLLLTPHKHVLLLNSAWLSSCVGSRRWWASQGDGQVAPVLCLSHCSCAMEFLLCESWELPGALTWTRERCLCVNPPRWSFLSLPQRAAFTFRSLSRWSQNSVLLKETIDMTHQLSGVQTCDLSVMWWSVQPAANYSILPALIRMSPNRSTLIIKT